MAEVKVPLDWPNLGELEKKYILDALDSGFVSTAGPLVPEFEARFADFLQAGQAVSTVNGTAGLHLALRLLGIGPGDEVIVPALTFVATVNPVIYANAVPVVVDVDPRTWNISPEGVRKAVTPRTKAIIPVHLYGNPADMDALVEIAREHDLKIIEDATEALGSVYQSKYAGTIGDIGVFSFNGNKVITTGGGGMLVMNNEELAERARVLVNQGRSRDAAEYEHLEVGFNYRLTNLQAALGLAQLERLPEFLVSKKQTARIYEEHLSKLPGLSFQQELKDCTSNWWLSSVLTDPGYGFDLGGLMNYLKIKGVQVRRLFKPVPGQPCYKSYRFASCPVAEELYAKGVNLPSATFLTEEDVNYVVEAIKNYRAASA